MAALAQSHEPFPDQAAQPSYTHQFRWDSSVPQQVLVKGSFDHWTSALHLIKEPSGKFGQTIQLPHGSRVLYKYIVDGNWRINPNEPTETDQNGNVNNLFQVPQYVPPPPPQVLTTEEDSPTDSQGPAPQSTPTSSDQSISVPHSNHASTTVSGSLSNIGVPATLSIQSVPVPHPTFPHFDLATFPKLSSSDPPSPSSRSARIPLRPPHSPQHRHNTTVSPTPGRLCRTPYRSSSLFGPTTAPGTPPDKSSPASTSVSTVVSAMAGAAATAIPAAIFAVTGKDLMAGSTSRSTPEDVSASLPSNDLSKQIKNIKPVDKLLEEKSISSQPNDKPDVEALNAISPHEENSSSSSLLLNSLKEIVDGKPADAGIPPAPEDKNSPIFLLNNPEDNLDGKPAHTHIQLPPSEHHTDRLITKLDPIAEPADVSAPSPAMTAESLSQPMAGLLASPNAIIEGPVPNTETSALPITEIITEPFKTFTEPANSQAVTAQPAEPISTEPKSTLPTTKQSSSDSPRPQTDSPSPGKGKYGNLSSNRQANNGMASKNGGTWRASVGSFGRNQAGAGERVADSPENLASNETPERKRKTSIFQKIKVALSPAHRKSPSTGGN